MSRGSTETKRRSTITPALRLVLKHQIMIYCVEKMLIGRGSQLRLSLTRAVSFILMMSLGVACQTPPLDPFVAEGRQIYKARCIACHGALGQGDGYVLFNPPVADLTSEHVQKKLDAELFRTIHQGRPNTAMGSWRLALSEGEILAVVQYVRNLGRSAVHF
jgi:cytochrome c553